MPNLDEKSCEELMKDILSEWDGLQEWERTQRAVRLADRGCRDIIPYLIKLLESNDTYSRCQALYSLSDLPSREHRAVFIDRHLNDPSEEVRKVALMELSKMYPGKEDIEILKLALDAFDDPASSKGMRLYAGAVMMYQLEIPRDELGGPGWWNEEEEDLNHPYIQSAVEQARNILKKNKNEV
jgi:hypothetical protein